MLMPRESQGPFQKECVQPLSRMLRVKCVDRAEQIIEHISAQSAALANLF